MSAPNESEVREALRKMIEVLRKYNIRYVLSTPEYETYWWLSIAVDIDDLYRTLCDTLRVNNDPLGAKGLMTGS